MWSLGVGLSKPDLIYIYNIYISQIYHISHTCIYHKCVSQSHYSFHVHVKSKWLTSVKMGIYEDYVEGALCKKTLQ